MKVVGLTGGIGSGKTTVANMFTELGVPVYIADKEAKILMNEDISLQTKIVDLLGEQSYKEGQLDRQYVASKVFNNTFLLAKLNAIVHPAVATHFTTWKNKQKNRYVIKEAAILFENNGYQQCDYTILVTAPEELRIQRVLQRDHSTRKEVLDRIKNQWSDSKKVLLADFVINNIKLEETKLYVSEIHKKIVK